VALKQSNNGQFTIPTAPSVGTGVAQSATPNTYGSYVQLIASTAEADYITGVRFGASIGSPTPTYMSVQLGVGGAGVEVTVGIVDCPIVFANASTTQVVGGFVPIIPPIPVAASARIAAKTASPLSSAQSWNIALTVCKQADLIDAGINESSNVTQALGNNVTTATNGVLDVNASRINNVAATSVTTINANVGQTQPVNFTGTGASALVKSDAVDIASTTAVLDGNGFLSVNVRDILGTISTAVAGTVGIDWAKVSNPGSSVGLSGTTISTSQVVASVTGAVGSVAGNVAGSVNNVVSAVILSAADSFVMQTGTASAGGPSAITIQTALGNSDLPTGCLIKITSGTGANQCRGIIAYNNVSKVVTVDRSWITQPDATSVYTILYADVAALNTSLAVTISQAFPANFSSLGITAAGKVSEVVLTDTLTTYTGNTVQTGDSFARIGATGSGLTSLAPSATALSTVQWTNTRAGNLDNLDATVSSRSTYAGGPVASVTGNVGGNVDGSVGSVFAGVTVTTNNDKTGYSLTQSFPANFSTLVISAAGIISANISKVNNVTVNGAGTAGNPWGP
jgi:hypothetical protein